MALRWLLRPLFLSRRTAWPLPGVAMQQHRQLSDAVRANIEQAIRSNRVCLFMKGSIEQPGCGFSGAAVRMLQAQGTDFAAVDVLSADDLRNGIKEYSGWPTLPQLYVDGELVGGTDIMLEMFRSGELERRVCTAPTSEDHAAKQS